MKKKTVQPLASSHWKRKAFEKNGDCQTDHAVTTARSHQPEADEIFQEQIPLIQITLSVFQVGQRFSLKRELVEEGIQDHVSKNVFLIGIGRNH